VKKWVSIRRSTCSALSTWQIFEIDSFVGIGVKSRVAHWIEAVADKKNGIETSKWEKRLHSWLRSPDEDELDECNDE
jgi:hypothetical protein